MKKSIPSPLFILEMANNHMGDVHHGLRIISEMSKVTSRFPYPCAFKLQYRDLSTFIHPAMQGRSDVKYVKRFSETRLSSTDFLLLIRAMRDHGFLAMATPFDERSVDLIEEQRLDIIKIASCSFTDWPLLERIARSSLPIITSTAGATLDEIDRVVSFFIHRSKEFAVLHCVGEYPTPVEHMHLSQIDLLKQRYPGIRIGFSTHEDPETTDIIKLAVAKGADVFEKHVGVPTAQYPLNAYSATPDQVGTWIQAAQYAYRACGEGDRKRITNEAEAASLRALRRGVFARRVIRAGETISTDDVYFAFPPTADQFTANDWSKYLQVTATSDIKSDSAIAPGNVSVHDQREAVRGIVDSVKNLLKESGIIFPYYTNLEISHHYGIERFAEAGLTMLTVVNRAYCKKLLIVLPGQSHPEQFHKKKEETFHILYGDIQLELDGKPYPCKPGDVVTIDPGVRHRFSSKNGAVIEEISSTHFRDDSYYTDPAIAENRNRKTLLSYWMD